MDAPTEVLWRVAVEASEDAVFGLDAAGLVVTWTKSAARLFGHQAEQILGRPSTLLVHADQVEEHELRVARVLAGERLERLRIDACRGDGMMVPVSLTLAPLGQGRGACAVARDLSEQEFAQATLAESELQLREAQELSHVGLWLWDPADDALQMSKELHRIHGVEPLEFGGTLAALLEVVHPDDRDPLAANLHLGIRTQTTVEGEYRVVLRDGEVRWVYARAAVERDGTGTVIGLRGIGQDITERVRAREELSRQALHDALTGLPNRALLLDRLARALQRKSDEPSFTAVVFIDVDNFKMINDSLGHEVGDRLLCSIARRLEGAIRRDDTAARFGGDEFIILCDQLPTEDAAVEMAERILAALATPIPLDGASDTVINASAGIAIASGDDAVPEALLRDADAALYRAKEEGKNRYLVFDAAMHRRATERLTIANELRTAIVDDQLRLLYQPQVDMLTGEICGVEALVRWQHPIRGLLGPLEFIAIAEETQQIVPLGGWVLQEACRQAAIWQRLRPDGPILKLCVNVSAKQLARAELADDVARALAESGLEPSSLCLEITESVLMSDADFFLKSLLALKLLGVTVAIDDFGTGYSSLAYLRRFPIDIIKVDKGFVDGVVGDDPRGRAVVNAVVDLAHALKLCTVAEGVETADQVRALEQLGCDMGQGYYFARPLAAEAVTELLAQPPRNRAAAGAQPTNRPLSTAAAQAEVQCLAG